MREGGQEMAEAPQEYEGETQHDTSAAPCTLHDENVKELGRPLISRWEVHDPNTRLTKMGRKSEQ